MGGGKPGGVLTDGVDVSCCCGFERQVCDDGGVRVDAVEEPWVALCHTATEEDVSGVGGCGFSGRAGLPDE